VAKGDQIEFYCNDCKEWSGLKRPEINVLSCEKDHRFTASFISLVLDNSGLGCLISTLQAEIK
jgi:hypothetical protein